MISLCLQYRARSACTSVQSDQALYCWLTNFKFSSRYPKMIMDSSKKWKMDYYVKEIQHMFCVWISQLCRTIRHNCPRYMNNTQQSLCYQWSFKIRHVWLYGFRKLLLHYTCSIFYPTRFCYLINENSLIAYYRYMYIINRGYQMSVGLILNLFNEFYKFSYEPAKI